MNPATYLESMGITLGLATEGKLTLEGLKRLPIEQRNHALAVAKEFKPFILEELGRRESSLESPTRSEWEAVACGCRFDNCTMWGDRKPLACQWRGRVQ